MSKIKLRNYQDKCIQTVITNAKKGIRRQVVVLATGTGKTIIFSHLPSMVKQASGKKTLILAHREELLDQAKDKLLFVDDSLKIAIEQGSRKAEDQYPDHDYDVLIASVPTIGRKNSSRIQKFNPDDFGLIIIDECFVAGTKIDGTPIEQIKVGDLVNSYNETTGRIEKKPVVRLFKNPAKTLVHITLTDGRKLTCTPGHPFFIDGNWVNANELKVGTELTDITQHHTLTMYEECKEIHQTKKMRGLHKNLSTEVLEQYDDSDLFGIMQTDTSDSTQKDSGDKLYPLSEKNTGFWKKSISALESLWESLLFGSMQKGVCTTGIIKNNGKHESKVRIGTNEEEQSNERSGHRSENDKQFQGENIFKQGRKWKDNNATKETLESLKSSKGNIRVSDKNSSSKTFIQKLTALLFSGYRYSRSEIGNRGGRSNAQTKKVEVFGQKKNKSSKRVRVASIEVLERGSGQRFNELCSDGFVYNFEVEGNNNYYAEEILVHNCHHATASTYTNILTYFDVMKGEVQGKHGRILLGVTATPNRSDHKGLDRVFDKMTFSYPLRQAIQDGYLVDIKAHDVKTQADISTVKTSAGDFSSKDLAEALNTPERNQLIVESYHELAPDTKAICFAVDIEHTKELTRYFNFTNVPAEYIIGETPSDQRKEILERFKNGETKVLVNCAVLTEGFDEPSIETVLMARPTKSSVLYSQMLGRGTRLHPGKEFLTLIDFADNTGRNHTASVAGVLGVPKNIKGKNGKMMLKYAKQVEEILEVHPGYPIEEIEDWTDEGIEKIIKDISIFAEAQLPNVVRDYSTFAWESYMDGYRINFPHSEEDTTREFMTVLPDMLGLWNLVHTVVRPTIPTFKNSFSKWGDPVITQAGTFRELKNAFQFADGWITANRGEFTTMLSQKSKWRNDEPSAKQLELMHKWNIPAPPHLTKGQASVLISKHINKRNARKAF